MLQPEACFWKMLEGIRRGGGGLTLRCLGTGGWTAGCHRSALMGLGRAAREIRVGGSRRCRRLSCLGKATQSIKGQGTVPWLPAGTNPCPATTIPPFSCLLCSGAAEASARKAVPARPHVPSPSSAGARLPSRACGFAAPFLLEARAVIVCSAKRGARVGGGVS